MKLTHSLVVLATISTLSFAGGDINPVTVFEQEPIVVPVEPVPEPAPEPAPEPEPAPAPAPAPEPTPAPEPVPVVPPVVAKPLGLYIAGGLTDVAVRSGDRANLFKDEKIQDRQIGLTGRLGYNFMDYLGAELRGTYGIAKDSGTKFKQVGGYLKPNYDVADNINLYGLLGVSKSNMNPSGNETGFSYGVGLDYGISDKISVFTDVVNYMKKSKTNSQWGATLGAAYHF